MPAENNRNYRIKTNIGTGNGQDKVVSFNLNQEYDNIEILSLKIDTENAYKLHTSKYGCIVGRVIANGGVGVPNAKVSVFIAATPSYDSDTLLNDLYPYTTSFSKDESGIRYNLFPDTQVSVCHTPIGTFPSKREVLDDTNSEIVYDTYYSFTTRTNDAGDYMLFGIPVGDQVVHTDIDLSDIGFLSQRPRDMVFKGYNITQFENANKFKTDTNIDNLTQVITQNDSVYVYPFWGEEEESEIKITRNDIEVQYKFEPTCVFIGSLISDERSNGILKNCTATERMGKMDRLTTGSGTIEMIRKAADGSVEEFSIQGNQLIDGNGVWCYQIPMNLDYLMTDEYGNLVPSDKKGKGIPTRTRVRFRVSLTDFQSDYENNHLAKVLIPNNPKTYDDLDYVFGTYTKDKLDGTGSFRDLFWNNVYTVKSYIPRIQKGNYNRNRRFTGFKQVNVNGSNNPLPYNNLRVDLTFMFVVQCAILKMLIKITRFINKLKTKSSDRKCTVLGEGLCPDLENWYFAPGCPDKSLDSTLEGIREELDPKSVDYQNNDDNSNSNVCITSKIDYLMQCIEINLAMEYEVIQFDFYNDWINGLLYIPRWFVRLRRKKSFLFGLIERGQNKRDQKVQACWEDNYNYTRRFTQQCSLEYSKPDSNSKYYTKVSTSVGCVGSGKKRQKCHKAKGRKHVKIFNGTINGGGLVHNEKTTLNNSVYYFKPTEWIVGKGRSAEAKRVILFATDIVLIGSLNDNDEHGVPRAFEELKSSTYLMPTNLAATNMDTNGYMYGTAQKGTRCSGVNYEGAIEPQPQTFSNYVRWSKNTDFYENAPDDPVEPEMTEAAGIDWGYRGPNQGEDSLNDLYLPGGHFLGMSCFNAAVNIKSCVNLSRICEIGSTLSQRQDFFSTDKNENLIKNAIAPTGLISKNELNESNFRRMFATMNHNGLKTKVNTENGFSEYEFIPMLPDSFGGELMEYTNKENSPYNKFITTEIGGTRLYNNTIDRASEDYYCFRLGLVTDEDKETAKKHYLIETGNNVSMPVYENSFYFYFGLKDGNTAIDRFFRDFYSECHWEKDTDMGITINTTDTEFCSDNGMANIDINGINSPYTISLSYDNGNTIETKKLTTHGSEITISESGSENIVTNFSELYIKGLSSGDYVLSVVDEANKGYWEPFTVESEAPKNVDVSIIDTTGFTSEVYGIEKLSKRIYNPANEADGFVAIYEGEKDAWSPEGAFNGLYGFIVFDNSYYTLISGVTGVFSAYTGNDIIKDIAESGYYDFSSYEKIEFDNRNIRGEEAKSFYVPAWIGNNNYVVSAIVNCNNNVSVYEIGSFNVPMVTRTNIYVGSPDFSWKFYNSLNIRTNTHKWVGQRLESGSTLEKWTLMQALYFRNSLYQLDGTNRVVYGLMNPAEDAVETLQGRVEAIKYEVNGDDNYSVLENSADITDGEEYENLYSSYDVIGASTQSIYFPTHYMSGKTQMDGVVMKNFLYKDLRGGGGSTECINYNGSIFGGIMNLQDINRSYRYSVNSNIDGRNMEFQLPSIYKPFYATGVKVIYEDGNKLKWFNRVNITNGIRYEYGKDTSGNTLYGYKKLIVDGVDMTDVTKTSGDTYDVSIGKYSNDWIGQTNGYLKTIYGDYDYTQYLSGSTETGTTSFSFSLEVEDGEPFSYEGEVSPLSISDMRACIFPTKKNIVISSGVRFYKIKDTERYRPRLIYSQFIQSSTSTLYIGETVTNESVIIGNIYCFMNIFGIYINYIQSETLDFIRFEDVTEGVFEMLNNDTDDKTFEDKLKVKYPGQLIMAICSPWSEAVDSIEEYNSYGGKIGEGDTRCAYKFVTPDTTTLTIVRLYKTWK